MTVPKTTVDGLTPRGQPTAETEGLSPKGGEFEAVLEKKAGKRRPGKGGRPASGEGPTRAMERGAGPGRTEGRALGGRAGDAAGTTPAGAREAAAEHALKEAESELSTRTATREGAGAPAGDLARPGPAGGAPTAPTDAARASEATARIERIAEQIVQAAEVRLHADGAVEARLQLDLGRLGRMNVALERTAEGQIRVALEPTSAEGRDVLQARGQELASRLEARGLKLHSLTVELSGETLLRVEGAGKEAAETAAARPAVPASESAPAERATGSELPAQKERSNEEHERRGRREPEPTGEEEEER
jgi:hypothetical protein